jgi:transmembrane sensor
MVTYEVAVIRRRPVYEPGEMWCGTTMMNIDQKLMDEACDWLAALDGDDPDFEGFSQWLEASPDHVRAYDAAVALDDVVTAHAPAIASALPANDLDSAPSQSRRGWFVAAAALALALPGATWWFATPHDVTFQSGASPTQIALDARTRIDLDRGSVLNHAKGQTNAVELAQGAAQFEVRHDPAKRFTVKAGDVAIVDLGTRFEVQRNGEQVSVAVAEGSVSVAFAGNTPIIIKAGLRALAEGGALRVSSFDKDSVASWRQGRLIYRDVPLSQVAREISRYSAVPVTVDAGVAERRFSGVLAIGDGRALDRNLADFMGLARIDEGKSVRIGARP